MAEIGDGFVGTQNAMGEGLAYVLPESRSEKYALQLAQEDSKLLARTAAAKLKRTQELQDNIGQQFASQKLDAMWSPYNKAVSDANAAWQTKAAQYNATTGKSPFANPELMNEYNQKVKGVALASKELGTNYSKLRGIAEADGGNKYTVESVKKVLDYENDIQKDPMAALNKPLPTLEKASATFDDLQKVIKPVATEIKDGYRNVTTPDRSSHIDQAASTVLNNPDKWAPLLQTQFNVDITKPTFPIVSKKNGRKIYPTNDKDVFQLADRTLSQKDAPEVLAEFGIAPDDEFAREKLMDVIKKQNGGFGKFLTETADNADAKVKKSSGVSFEAERMNLSREASSRARTKFSERGSSNKTTGELYRQEWIDDMFNGVEGSGEKLKAIVAARPGYKQPVIINDRQSDGIIKIKIPDKETESFDADGNIKYRNIPGRIVTINTKDTSDKSKLNQVLNELTGEKVSESKFVTGNASGKRSGKTTKTSTPTKSESSSTKTVSSAKISGLVGKPGYEGYTKQELINYYKKQGYKID